MDEVGRVVRKIARRSNKSLYFLLPMLGFMYQFEKNYILNSFIADRENRPDIGNYHIFMLVDREYEKLNKHQNFIEHYTIDEGIMYVFKVPVQYEEDYLKFILGKYSEFSAEYKQHLCRMLPTPIEKSTVFKVITKSPEAKAEIEKRIGASIGNQEVFSVPDVNEEIYG